MFINEYKIMDYVEESKTKDRVLNSIHLRYKKKTKESITEFIGDPRMGYLSDEDYYIEVEESLLFLNNFIFDTIGKHFYDQCDIDFYMPLDEEGKVDESTMNITLAFHITNDCNFQRATLINIFEKINPYATHIHDIHFVGHHDGLCNFLVDLTIPVDEFRKRDATKRNHQLLNNWASSLTPIFLEVRNRKHFSLKYAVRSGNIVIEQSKEKVKVQTKLPDKILSSWRKK